MKLSTIIISLGVVLLGVLVLFSIPGKEDNEGYLTEIAKERSEKNEFLKSEESPFGEERASFTGLKYYEPDLKFRLHAKLVPIESKKVVVLSTSAGKENQYLEYAWIEFELDGTTHKLLLLEVMSAGPMRGTLFLAFADETSARETYGAGRYLEVKKVRGATSLELDFNRAYNPYCAYVNDYECPFPPPENVLKVAIQAGEKTYH